MMYSDKRDQIIDFIRTNHADIVVEILKEFENYEMVDDIVKNATGDHKNLSFKEYIVAVYQAIIIEWASFEMFDVMDIVTWDLLVSMFGNKLLCMNYWEYRNWN
jgi:hypothetical protein